MPGGALYWTVVTLFLMFVPTLVQFVFSLGRAYFTKLQGAMRDAVSGFGQGTFICLLKPGLPAPPNLAGPGRNYSFAGARFITGQRLLEWETAAEAESGSRRTPVDRYLAVTPLVSVVVGVLVFLRHPESLLVALPILILWAFAGGITAWLNNPPTADRSQSSPSEEDTLPAAAGAEDLALLQPVWRREPQLPDSRQRRGRGPVRSRARFANQLWTVAECPAGGGYVRLSDASRSSLSLTKHSLETYDKLEKFRGHIFNWYDTRDSCANPSDYHLFRR